MWRSVGLAVAGSCLAVALPAEPYDDSVQRGLAECRSAADGGFSYEAGRCIGVASGVGSMLAVNCYSIGDGYSPSLKATAPPSTGAAVQAFINWAEDHPERWGDLFAFGMARALVEAFPCPTP